MRDTLHNILDFMAPWPLYIAAFAGLAASVHVGYVEMKFFGVLLALAFFWLGAFIAPLYLAFHGVYFYVSFIGICLGASALLAGLAYLIRRD